MSRPYADFCVMVVDPAESQPWCRNSLRWPPGSAAAGVGIGLDCVNPPAPVFPFGHYRFAGMLDPMVLDVAPVVVVTHQ
jgi:hypothetical protein